MLPDAKQKIVESHAALPTGLWDFIQQCKGSEVEQANEWGESQGSKSNHACMLI